MKLNKTGEAGAAESGVELPGEEYAPINGATTQSGPTPPPASGATEQWGGGGQSGGLQERNL